MGWSGPTNIGPVVTPGAWKSALALASPNDRTLSANGDKQYYWDPGGSYSAYVQKSAGLLTIRANSAANTVSNPSGLPYNSGAIVSAIRSGTAPAAGFFSFTTGYVEVSARLPKGNGTFPSVMLQAIADTNYEIDVVQAHGSNATSVLHTIRYTATDSLQMSALSTNASVVSARQARTTVADYSAAFHTYGVDKQNDFVTWYVDRIAVASYPASGIPVRPYYIIVSLAMGGNGDVDPDTTTPLPADFDIDYVSVWTNAAAAGIQPGPTPTPSPTSTATPVPTPTPTPTGTGKFSVANGKIIGPDGNVFVARGFNVYDFQLPKAVTNAAAQPLTTLFRGMNFVRLNYGGSTSPYTTSGLEPYITQMTNNKIVVMIEDHTGISKPPYTGTTLQNELSWYQSLANTYKNNPYVWFGTFNEPGQGTNLPAIWTQQKAIFDTIRGTGNTNMMSIQCPSGGNPGTVGVNGRGYDGSGPMMSSVPYNNIFVDLHYYDWAAGQTHLSDDANGYSSDPATILATLKGNAANGIGVAAAQTWTSNDGTIPVIIGEFGPSTTGNTPDDPGGTALVDVVCQAAGNVTSGFAAWHLGDGDLGTDDNLTNSGFVMTSYGNQVAGYIASAPPPAPTPTPAPVANESPNNTVVTTLTTPVIIDALGNQWNIVNGTFNGNPSQQIGFNGAAQSFTNNVVELAYVNHVVWQQNNLGNWYSMGVQNGAVITVSGPTTTSPLPPAPTPTPTPAPTLPAGKTRVVAPLTSPATAGTWVTNQSFAAPMPGGGGVLRYNIQYPQNYSKTSGVVWPVVFLGHENDQGMNGSSYPRDGGTLCSVLDMALGMSTVTARTNYPCILVLPQIDQTLDTSGANGNANGGGYNDSPMSGQNEQAVAGLAKFILANEAADPTRMYIIGASLGGIWMLAQMVDNNRINGAFNKLWTAGMSFSDQLFRPSVPNANVFGGMLNVPVIAVSTNSDNDPNSYDRPAYQSFAGNTNYPTKAQYDSTGVSALRAGTSQYYYMDYGSSNPWTVFSYTNADGGDGTRLLDLLFSFII